MRVEDDRVRWDELFADLEAQFDELGAAELEAEIAERTRVELSRVRLVDRLRASIGRTVGLRPLGAHGPLTGRVDRVGTDWLLLTTETGTDTVIVVAAVAAFMGDVSPRADDPLAAAVPTRLGIGHILRRIARDRATVSMTLVDGSRLTGTVDRVGIDHLDFAEHDPDVPRRTAEIRGIRVVPFTAVALVRRRQ